MDWILQFKTFSFLDHVLFFLLVVVFPMMSIASARQVDLIRFDRDTKINLYYGNSLMFWILASVILTIWNYMDRSFVEFGFRWPEWTDVAIMLTCLFAALYFLDIGVSYIIDKKKLSKGKAPSPNIGFLPQNLGEFRHYTFLAFSAGVCEEIIFRGFLIHYLISLFGTTLPSLLFAISLPAILFTVGHIYQGKWAVLKIFLGAILLSLIYITSKSILLVIIIHILVDIISAVFAYFFYKKNIPQKSKNYQTQKQENN